MIEFRESKNEAVYFLFHNGKQVKDISISFQKGVFPSDFEFVITANNRKAGNRLISLLNSEADFPEYNRLAIHNWNLKGEIKFDRLLYTSNREYFTFSVTVKDIENENSEIDFYSFISSGLKNKNVQIGGASTAGDNIDLELEFKKEESFLESILEGENKAREYCESAINKFLKKNDINPLITTFDFPEILKITCEQYLLYFVKFLQDLGINATSSLKEEAGKVLFSVTPTDDVEALDKIREALAVYLNLPSSPVAYDESIPSMRLKQQIDNLQHSLRMSEMEFRLAQRVIESQDKIIQQKDLTIEQQSKILEKLTDKAVMINSAENKEELEELFEGVKIGKSKFLAEQGGLYLNPLTALKSVGKKLAGKDSEIISLNLSEETDLQD